MSLIAEFDVSSPGIALSEAVSRTPEIELELIQQVGTDPERPYMFIWAEGPDLEAFERAMGADPTVAEIEPYARMDHQILYRMRITEAADVVCYPMWVELGAEQLEAGWSEGRWHVRMRFPDRDALAECRGWCEDNGVEFELRRVFADDEAEARAIGLTAEQLEVLRVARDMGYFEIPRAASMAEVAAELGISSQAVSERLRRAHRFLADDYLP